MIPDEPPGCQKDDSQVLDEKSLKRRKIFETDFPNISLKEGKEA
jgi:hypothetical protein